MERIDLAHEKEFRLGGLTVRPALRQLVRGDRQEVVEPRVMQVLVALARESGGIVSRDDLTHSCWEGRVVGEDAINRVISRLRRSAEGIGEREFRIETITKVGYRLVRDGADEAMPLPANDEAAAAIAEARKLRLDRRAMLIGSGAAVVAAGGWWGWRRLNAPAAGESPPADVADLVAQARLALRQGSPDSANQATGLLKRAVEKRPDYADGWGLLAITYARGAQQAPPRFEATMRSRAEEAIERALKLEPDNANAAAARIALRPSLGGWLANERDLRAGLLHHPENEYLQSMFSGLLLGVGRCREAADRVVAGWNHYSPSPGIAYGRVVCLWAADRLDEADAAANEAYALFPTQYAVWFTRVYLLMYTGRATEALAILRSVETRPEGIPDWNFDMVIDAAQALATRAPADIEKAMASNIAGARKGTGFAENTIQYASALGRIDTAFEIADAYYFGKGFETGDLAYAPEQRQYRRRSSRRTNLLFLPSTSAMRADKRFAALVEQLGLERYWADSGVAPDYRRTV